ncbi:MAG: phage holin family protein [Actinomycetota bacterium]|nr:phage holin family protein [Actinomycetota bacterium]
MTTAGVPARAALEEESMTTTDEGVDEPTIGRLVADASRDISGLIRGEIALAKSELKISVRAGGIGAGLLGAAAFLGMLAIVLLSISVAHFIDMIPGINTAVAFLIVFAIYLLIAAVLAFVGIRKFRKVGPPERAIAQAQKSKDILGKDHH